MDIEYNVELLLTLKSAFIVTFFFLPLNSNLSLSYTLNWKYIIYGKAVKRNRSNKVKHKQFIKQKTKTNIFF